jgi:hypothetical protein
MAITYTIEKPPATVVLTPPTGVSTVKDLSDVLGKVAADIAKDPILGTDPRIEWRPPPAAWPDDSDWKKLG